MKKINLINGGFPGTTKTFQHLAEMTEQVAAAVAQMAGRDRVIISGVEFVDGLMSSGWVVIDGELYPFVGGNENSHVRIVENVEQVQYLADTDNNGIGDMVDAYFNRFALFTSVAEGNIPFAEFERYENLVGGVSRSGTFSLIPSTVSFFVTGDFTGVANNDLADAPGQQAANALLFQIEFEEIDTDYDVIFLPIDPQTEELTGSTLLVSALGLEYFVFNKTNTSFDFILQSADLPIFLQPGQANFQINLIKK
jgi:hypothetical protein